VTSEPEFFAVTEGSSGKGEALASDEDRNRARISSVLVHLAIVAILLLGSLTDWFGGAGSSDPPVGVQVRFYTPGGEGRGGGGGGGGDHGKKPTAYIPVRIVKAEKADPPVEDPKPREAPVAPRKPRALSFDELNVPDLPQETALLFQGVFSPDAVESPGLSLTDGRDLGGLDREPSAGTGGGIGGGTGTGVGTGAGWGVGPGRGGGYGGGDYAPGGWDIEPVPIYRPPDPPYPPMAREKMVAGEVILQVLVKLDGSTEVVRVVKSLPFCVDAAKANARLWRWKPALKDGKPVEAFGIITVTFDIFAQGNAKS
jgi:periplasmic protein TonB